MTVLVGDRNLCSELERLELEVSRGCEQDLVFDLCWMLRDSSCQDSGACSRLQDLFLYAKACGWHSLAEYVLQVAGRKGMLPEVTKVGEKTYPFRGDMDAPQALMVLPTMVLEWNDAHLSRKIGYVLQLYELLLVLLSANLLCAVSIGNLFVPLKWNVQLSVWF
jgi:hypothetical protein